MITKFHIPTYPLDQFIDHIFYYTGFNPQHSVDRFLPDGEVQVIFDLTGHPKSIYHNDTLKEVQSCKQVWFSGFRTEPITIPSGKESEMLVVQFKKGKAFPFLCEPMYALTNYVVDAEQVLTKDILDLYRLLSEQKSIAGKISELEKGLLKCYKNKLVTNPFIDFAVSEITSNPKQLSIKELSDKTGYSHKHLIKLFKQQVGVTPKEFLNVIRFQKAIQEIEQQQFTDWSSVAYDCGFYDQSHFIADFKKFSGYTPTEYTRIKGEFLNYIPVG